MRATLLFILLLHVVSRISAQQIPQFYEEYINRSKNQNLDVLISEVKNLNHIEGKTALLGELYLLKGRNDLSLNYFDSALSEKKQDSHFNSSELYCRTLSNKGILLWNEGKDELALEHLQQALYLRNKREQLDHNILADNFNNLGLIYSGIDYDEAIDFYKKSLILYGENKDVNLSKIIQTTINISLLEASKGNYKQSLSALNQAMEDWKKVFPDPTTTEAFILVNLANNYSKIGDPVLAEYNYLEAIEIYKNALGEKNTELASAYMLLADVYKNQNEFKKALNFNQKALISNSFEFSDTDVTQNPELDDAIKPYNQLIILLRKSEIFEAYYNSYSLKKQHLLLALESLESADHLIQILRSSRTSKKDLLALSELASDVYENTQRITIKLNEVSLFTKEHYKKALLYAEKSKASSLLGALAESEAKSFGKIPETLLTEENQLKNEIAYLSTQLSLASTIKNESFAEKLREDLFQNKSQYETLVSTIKNEYPDYYNLKHNLQVANLSSIQAGLETGEAILNYSYDRDINEIYLYYISKRKFEVYRIKSSNEIDKWIRAYRNTLSYNLKKEFEQISYQLFTKLLPFKIEKEINRLTVIPDGDLAKIPFEALLTSKPDNSTNYSSLPYLIKEYEINYGFSTTLHLADKKQIFNKEALLVAPVSFQSLSLPDLPGTSTETTLISEICGRNNIHPSLLRDVKATENNFKNSELKRYQFIHFATHGLVDIETPELSGVFFNKADSAEDGVLYAGEIYALEINADLVSLSACETGLGKISRGEGVLGLGRAFSYAGANNLMVSIWKVADSSTAALMGDFYTNSIGEGETYSSALRNAKLEMIRSDSSSPYFWAPFILWGK
ncbi:tetratricopeptide repeat domain protein [Marivirga lumbricoides]|uniref:Tetratricopeptide repeat domain protein n=1 Tax=Marivirga lumbricoides TaxID=1046115 RepID=A0ABQ1MRJ2_9BACT|nr:tetratricopeptide repeat domain protein [Marivirga lumbricoides]